MLILASKSPTRNALLAGAGLKFSASLAPIDERALELTLLGKSAADVAEALAVAKAMVVAGQHADAVVIGADQVLALGDERFHKPADIAEARAQLRALRGRTHHLHSGVALVRGDVLWSGVESAALTMRAFSNAELDAVLEAEGDAALASVGGYRLEGVSIHLFERIEGDYFTILGLPLLPLLAALRQHAPSEGFT